MWKCALLCQLSHCNIRYGLCKQVFCKDFFCRIQMWLLSQKEIKSFVMLLSSLSGRHHQKCREGSGREGCQQVMQRLRRESLPEHLYTTEVYPNKDCRSLRLIIKANTGPEVALNWLCVGCDCLLCSKCGWEPNWRFTTVIHDLACT